MLAKILYLRINEVEIVDLVDVVSPYRFRQRILVHKPAGTKHEVRKDIILFPVKLYLLSAHQDLKKVGYLCVIAVAMVVDYLIANIAGQLGIQTITTTFFGLLVAVWYILNELLSIIENAGRMGAQIPEWLRKYIAILKQQIDEGNGGDLNGNGCFHSGITS